MSLGSLLVTIWGILVCVSQYLIGWFTFGHTGLVIIGVIGLVGFVLWLVNDYHPIVIPMRRTQG
jgi:hypothetical protein